VNAWPSVPSQAHCPLMETADSLVWRKSLWAFAVGVLTVGIGNYAAGWWGYRRKREAILQEVETD
jgi:hypothetical protein